MAQIEPVVSNSLGTSWLERLGNAVADLLFPPHCVVCQGFGAWLCRRCVDEIEVIQPPLCYRCGLPLAGAVFPQTVPPAARKPETAVLGSGPGWVCRQCRTSPKELDGLRAYAYHTGPLRKAIHDFKYHGLQSLAGILGALMSQGWLGLAPHGQTMDVIAPIPLHRHRQRERGFNQAALLSRELGARLRRPVMEEALIRTKPTSPQVGLNPDERRANVDGAFRCITGGLAGKRVLLVDDVYTTGSTMDAACRALREAGVRSVWAYTLARAGDRPTGQAYIYEKEAGQWN